MYEFIDGHKHMIRLLEKTKSWVVPEWATYIECDDMGLQEVKLHENVEFFYAKNNMLTELHIPVGIRCLDIENNRVSRLTSDGPIRDLFSIDIRNNGMLRFDLEISNTVDNAYILGNPGIRIKNPIWLFMEDYALVRTDIYEQFLDEYLRARLYHMCKMGIEYVDLDKIRDDEYCESLGLSLD